MKSGRYVFKDAEASQTFSSARRERDGESNEGIDCVSEKTKGVLCTQRILERGTEFLSTLMNILSVKIPCYFFNLSEIFIMEKDLSSRQKFVLIGLRQHH